MRGAVSLAAALALPLETDAGAALPGRDLILFITFALILFTVVVQGLTLPALVRRLGVGVEESDAAKEEAKARYVAARAGIARIEELAGEDWTNDDTIERARGLREFRIRRLKVRLGKSEDEDGVEERSLAYQRLMRELYTAERAALIDLRNQGEIGAEVINGLVASSTSRSRDSKYEPGPSQLVRLASSAPTQSVGAGTGASTRPGLPPMSSPGEHARRERRMKGSATTDTAPDSTYEVA